MNRYHCIELSDQRWFPSSLFRDSLEFLQFFENVTNVFGGTSPLLRRVLRHLGTNRIVDLCSGSGGPWPRLSRHIEDSEGLALSVRLTDKNPAAGLVRTDHRFSGNGISCLHRPVDAMDIPDDLDGMLTFFNSFHHFPPGRARAILSDAARKGRGIGIFEATERTFSSIIQMALILPAAVWILTPFMRPRRLSRLFWTYIIPLLPLVITFDGIVSSLRTYTPKELERLAPECPFRSYTWEAGVTRAGRIPRNITYLVGYPSENMKQRTRKPVRELVIEKTKKPMDNEQSMVYNETSSLNR